MCEISGSAAHGGRHDEATASYGNLVVGEESEHCYVIGREWAGRCNKERRASGSSNSGRGT